MAADGEQTWRESSDRENSARIGVVFSWEVDVFNRLESIRWLGKVRQEPAAMILMRFVSD